MHSLIRFNFSRLGSNVTTTNYGERLRDKLLHSFGDIFCMILKRLVKSHFIKVSSTRITPIEILIWVILTGLEV